MGLQTRLAEIREWARDWSETLRADGRRYSAAAAAAETRAERLRLKAFAAGLLRAADRIARAAKPLPRRNLRPRRSRVK